MGYTTEFYGDVRITPPLNEAERSFLNDLRATRRMSRTKGPLFVKGSGDFGQGKDEDILEYNSPDPSQPGLWLQWQPTENGAHLEWDQGEKFYNAVEWMEYLINNLLSRRAMAYVTTHSDEDERLAEFTCDHVLNGEIEARGEDPDDRWMIVVENNKVGVADVVITYKSPEWRI